MNNDFRSRVLMPIVLPIVMLLAIAAFVGAVAMSLLFNTHEGSLMLAALAAAGILFTVSLAASHDRLTSSRRGVLVFAAALPILAGSAVAAGLVGDVDDEARMINVEPLLTIPDDAPLIAAENAQEFCMPAEDGSCEAIEQWEVTPSEDEENLSYVFENLDSGVTHNVVVTNVQGSGDDAAAGEEEFAASELITGEETDYYVADDTSWDELPEEWYFFCAVHPNMNGTGTVVDGEGESAEAA